MSRYRNADASPFEDDYRGFEIRDDETARGPLILALAIGVLLVFGAVVWNTYRQGVRSTGAGIPSVLAEAQPYKRVPEVRGGLEVRDTEKRFYDQMDASERAPEVAGEGDIDDSAVLQGGPPIELRPGMDDSSVEGDDPENGMPNAVADQVRELADLSRPETRTTIDVASTSPVQLPKSLPAPPKRDPLPAFAFNSDGDYLVQVAAFRTQDAAETAWKKASAAHPDLYRGAGKRIQRADLGAKGVFYRLRIGAFLEKSEASAFCDALKATGDNCIVVSG
ncbi:MAG: SPOR domain-containing protein [Hyphomonas sp.]|nr:SPOR domain-containing protein [Hyphomonas sp.]